MTSRASVREVFLAPLILCSVMVACALVTGQLAGISMRALIVPYVTTSLAITFVALLLTVFWWVLQLAFEKADAPLRTVKERLVERAPLLVLPALIFPLFLASFTATKTAIPFLVGYTWDPFWAQADRLIFGDDAWRIAHHWLGGGATTVFQWFYVVGWGAALIFVFPFVALNASAKFNAKFYTAMMTTWFIGGFVLAYLLSAAGPVFAHLVNSNGANHFTDLQRFLNSSLASGSPIRLTQAYLASALESHVAVKGGGISAMPSMHVAVVSIYVISARRTLWFVPALLFWIVIFICSAYFGYHYWIDGVVAAAVAGCCWGAAEQVLHQTSGVARVPIRVAPVSAAQKA